MEQDPGVPGHQLTAAPILPTPEAPESKLAFCTLSSCSPHFCGQRGARLCLWLPPCASPFARLRRPAGPPEGGERLHFCPGKLLDSSPLLCQWQPRHFGSKQDPSPPSRNPILHPKASTAGRRKPKPSPGTNCFQILLPSPPAKHLLGLCPRSCEDTLRDFCPPGKKKNLYLRKANLSSPTPPTPPQTQRRNAREDKKRGESQNYHG